MKKVNILFLNNKALEELGAYNMPDVIKDVENAYKLTELGDVNIPGKLVMRTIPGGRRILQKLAGAQLPRICLYAAGALL